MRDTPLLKLKFACAMACIQDHLTPFLAIEDERGRKREKVTSKKCEKSVTEGRSARNNDTYDCTSEREWQNEREKKRIKEKICNFPPSFANNGARVSQQYVSY